MVELEELVRQHGNNVALNTKRNNGTGNLGIPMSKRICGNCGKNNTISHFIKKVNAYVPKWYRSLLNRNNIVCANCYSKERWLLIEKPKRLKNRELTKLEKRKVMKKTKLQVLLSLLNDLEIVAIFEDQDNNNTENTNLITNINLVKMNVNERIKEIINN